MQRQVFVIPVTACVCVAACWVDVAAQETSFSYDSSPLSWIGRGYTDYRITPDDGWSFEGTRNQVDGSNAENALTFSLRNLLPNDPEDPQPARDWLIEFAAPDRQLIVPGLYEGATRFPFQPDDKPGIDISGTRRGEFDLAGTFEVLEAVYAADGTLDRFAVDFTTIEDNNPAEWIVAELRYNSLVPEPASAALFAAGLVLTVRRRR
ncbi:MAG: PEP-CTERM sorting domain-containing protein [Phycisphaeraceae bacterium]